MKHVAKMICHQSPLSELDQPRILILRVADACMTPLTATTTSTVLLPPFCDAMFSLPVRESGRTVNPCPLIPVVHPLRCVTSTVRVSISNLHLYLLLTMAIFAGRLVSFVAPIVHIPSASPIYQYCLSGVSLNHKFVHICNPIEHYLQ